MKKEINITPIRMIRIIKDISMEEMADLFMVSKAYISAIENNQRKFRIQTLKYGLDKLNISLENYYILEEFSQELLITELPDRDKYKFMLIKTLGVVEPDTMIQTEELLQNNCYKKIRKK